MRLLTLLILVITITCQAQVNGTFKSVKIINSDSTHGELDGTEYRNSAGLYRYKENGVWKYRASISYVDGNFWKLSGSSTITNNVSIEPTSTGDGFTLQLGTTGKRFSNISLRSAGTQTYNSDDGAGSSSSITHLPGQIVLNAVSASANNALTINNSGSFQFTGGKVTTAIASGFAPINIAGQSSDPTTLSNNDLFINTTGSDLLKVRLNGVSETIIAGSLSTTQVLYGSGTQVRAKGESVFIYDENNDALSVPRALLTPTATLSGLNIGSIAGDPSSAANNDLWGNSSSGRVRARYGGANHTLISFDDVFSSSLAGVVPSSGGGTTNFLRADGTWAAAGGTIGGTISATQVGYGSGANTLTSEAAFNYTQASNLLQVNAGTINVLGVNNGNALLVEDDAGNDIIRAYESSGSTNVDVTVSGSLSLIATGSTLLTGNGVSVSSGSVLDITGNTDLTLTASTGDIFITNVPDLNNSTTQILGRNSGTGKLEYKDASTFTSPPGGSNTQVQFNNSGAFGGDADLTFSGSTLTATNLTVTTIGDTHIPFATTSGSLVSESGLTYNTSENRIRIIGGTGNSFDTRIGMTGSGDDGFVLINGGTETEYGLNGITSGRNIITDVSTSGGHIRLLQGEDAVPGVMEFIFERVDAGNLIFIIRDLPTSCSGLGTGTIYNNSGTLSVCP